MGHDCKCGMVGKPVGLATAVIPLCTFSFFPADREALKTGSVSALAFGLFVCIGSQNLGVGARDVKVEWKTACCHVTLNED